MISIVARRTTQGRFLLLRLVMIPLFAVITFLKILSASYTPLSLIPSSVRELEVGKGQVHHIGALAEALRPENDCGGYIAAI